MNATEVISPTFAQKTETRRMIKIVGIIRALSIVLFLITLGLVYAYLPVTVKVLPNQVDLMLHTSSVFYYAVAFFVVINLFTWRLVRLTNPLLLLKRVDVVTAWFNALVPILNVYFSMIIAYMGVLNNPLSVSAQGFAYLNYIGPVLLLIWLVMFFYLSVNKKSTS